MIEDAVNLEIEAFALMWHDELSSSPYYELDATWPSLSVLDHFLSLAWAIESPNSDQQALVRQITAYIAAIIHDCWSANGMDVQVELDSEVGVVLSASGGQYLPPDHHYKVNLEQELASLYQLAPETFPVFRGFDRHLSMHSRPAALFALGILCGLSVQGEGDWHTLSTDELMPHILNVARALALQSAVHYSRLFPDEPLGTYPELYLKSLVFPPLYMNETKPGERALRGVLSFAEAHQADRSELLALARNLSRFSDESISSAGLALYAALVESPSEPDMCSLLALRGADLPMIRARTVALREQFSFGGDWIDLPEDQAVAEFERERELGLIPYLFLSLPRVLDLRRDPAGQQLLRLLCDGDMAQAHQWFSKGDIGAEDRELHQQLWLIDLVRGAVFPHNLVETPIAGTDVGDPVAFYLTGLTFLVHQDFNAAALYFQRSLENLDQSDWLFPVCVENYLSALSEGDRHDEVLEVVTALYSTGVETPSTMLAEFKALREVGRRGEALVVRHQLMELCPYDRSVFNQTILFDLP